MSESETIPTNEAASLLKAIDGNMDLFELLVTTCRDILSVQTAGLSYLYVSSAVENTLGYRQEALLKKSIYEFMHPGFEEQIHKDHQRLLQGESFITKPFQYRCSSGEYIWIESLPKPVFDQKGALRAIVASSRNVSLHAFPMRIGTEAAPLPLLEASYVQYKKSQKETIQQHVDKLKNILEVQQVYLDPTLSLATLAERLLVHPKFLSYLINEVLQTSFYTLINGYRIAEAKKKLVDPNYNRLSITGIAYESGFNSRSAFYNAFKKILNIAPKDFLNA